uniref:PITH domain-containing protein n=1 Tax=Parastrongyloides trichosuri TaxID=131310 RepID=A0A0N4ZHK3_PARTI
MKYLLLIVTVLVNLSFLEAKICPLNDHYVCNKDVSKHACVCALIKKDVPAPEKSCNLVANIVNDEFEASSISFNLDDSSEQFNTFPEVAFKKEIASALKVKVTDIVIVRLGCADNDKKLTVQFLILKENNEVMKVDTSTLKGIINKKKDFKILSKMESDEKESDETKEESNEIKDKSGDNDSNNTTDDDNDDTSQDSSENDNSKDDTSDEKEDSNDDDENDESNDDNDDESENKDDKESSSEDDEEFGKITLYEQGDFIDSHTIVKKMKTMGHMSQIAELDVDEIQVVKNLISIENYTNNFVLFVQGTFLTIAILLTCVCGCWMSCKKNDYSDDLQKV